MKSAILSALALVSALAGLLSAAEPPDVPTRAPGEILPRPARTAATPDAKKPSGKPIGLTIRVYEMDTAKLKDSIDFRPQKEDRRTVNDQLEEMRKLGIVKVVAEPHLVAMDGRPATMLSGGEVPVLSPAAKNTVAIDFIPFGTRVDVTPKRIGKDRVQIRINAEFTRPSAHGLALDGPKDAANPVILGRSIRTAATLGPKDIVVLNDSEAREEDEPRKVTFMTIELADLGVEAALLQFDGQVEGLAPPAEGAIEVPRRNVHEFPNETPFPPREPLDSFGVEKPIETGGRSLPPGRAETSVPAGKRPAKIPENSFFLKPGKSQLELVRGTWKSFTIPSKDFAYGSSLLVESPDQGAISISGRNLTAQFDGPAKTESFEAGQNGEKYAADIWTIRAQRPGVATIRLIDDDDQSHEVEITVVGDTRHFDRMVKRFHPNAKVEAIELTEQSVVITGEASPQDAIAIQEIAHQLYGQVLLRLKKQPAEDQLLEGLGEADIDFGTPLEPTVVTPGDLASETGDQTFPSEAGATIAEPDTATEDARTHSSAIGDEAPARTPADGPVPVVGAALISETGSTPAEGYFDGGEAPRVEPYTAEEASAVIAYRETSQPPAPTTQIRFLNTGFISMRTPQPSSGELRQVPMWDPLSTWKTINGQSQQVRYNTHRENVAQGSRTLFQFRTTEFRNDVWVNGLLLTAVGNAKTRYFLQHFPVDLLVENHEVIAAAKGSLVTRIVVMNEERPPARTEKGETIEPRFSFTGPKSFEQAVEEGRKQGELIAVLVLGPESVLENGVTRNRFRLPAGQSIGSGWDQFEPDTSLDDPYGERKEPASKVGFNDPGQFEGTVTTDSEKSHWVARADSSVSGEMRQLRHEVRSLRQQLAKLVEVLSREHAPNTGKEEPDRVIPAPPRTVPIPLGTDGGFERGETPANAGSATLPPPDLDDGVGPRSSTPEDDRQPPTEKLDPFNSEPPPRRNVDDKAKPEPGPITSVEETRPTLELESPFASEPVPDSGSDFDSEPTIKPPLPGDSTESVPLPEEIPEPATE